MAGGGAASGGRPALILAAVFLALLGVIEVGLYRPAARRAAAAAKQIEGLREELLSVTRRRETDETVMRYVGGATGPGGFQEAYSRESGLVYMTRLINESHLVRLDFRTEASDKDGPFVVEHFFVTLRGSFPTILAFLRRLEEGDRLVRVEQFRMDPDVDSGRLLIRFRAGVYGLPSGGADGS